MAVIDIKTPKELINAVSPCFSMKTAPLQEALMATSIRLLLTKGSASEEDIRTNLEVYKILIREVAARN